MTLPITVNIKHICNVTCIDVISKVVLSSLYKYCLFSLTERVSLTQATAQCYKTLNVRYLCLFMIGQSFVSDRPYQPSIMFDSRANSRVEHLKGDLLLQALSLTTNIRISCKGLPESNNLSYYENSVVNSCKALGPGSGKRLLLRKALTTAQFSTKLIRLDINSVPFHKIFRRHVHSTLLSSQLYEWAQ